MGLTSWKDDEVRKTDVTIANDFHNLGDGYIIIGVGEENGRPVLRPTGLPAKRLDTIQKEPVEVRILPDSHTVCSFP